MNVPEELLKIILKYNTNHEMKCFMIHGIYTCGENDHPYVLSVVVDDENKVLRVMSDWPKKCKKLRITNVGTTRERKKITTYNLKKLIVCKCKTVLYIKLNYVCSVVRHCRAIECWKVDGSNCIQIELDMYYDYPNYSRHEPEYQIGIYYDIEGKSIKKNLYGFPDPLNKSIYSHDEIWYSLDDFGLNINGLIPHSKRRKLN